MRNEAAPFPVDSLVAPLSWEAFLTDVWDRDYRVFSGQADRSFETLFSRSSAEELIASSRYRSDCLRLMRGGAILRPVRYTRPYRSSQTLLDPAKVSTLYRDGATLEFNSLERFWPPLDAFCAQLQDRLGSPVGAGAFLSPPNPSHAEGRRALDAHFDTMDLMILQVSGRKRWRFFETPYPKPLDDQTWSAERHQPGGLREEVMLQPGDVIYLMRGTVHDALTEDEHSLHLAISLFPFRAHDALMAAVRALADDVRFRNAFQPHTLTDSDDGRLAFAKAFDAARELAMTALSAEAAARELRERLGGFERKPREARLEP